VRLGNLQIESRDVHHQLKLEVLPGEIPPDDLIVELYAEPVSEGGPVRETTTADKEPASPGVLLYSVEVHATRAPGDYTPRVIACRPSTLLPLESTQILWRS